MRPSVFLAGAAAIIAIAGCNSNEGNAATGGASAVTVKVDPPKNGDWSTVVTPTPAGGFLMGNPNAKVQLIEYGSMTCPHCREFDETGVQPLIENYVKSGKVGFEFRNYVRDPFDLTASLIARCNGAQSFFPMMRALYRDQPTWIASIQKLPEDRLNALENMPPSQQFLELAKVADFQQYAAVRGVPVEKSTKCLSDEASVNQLVQMTGDATAQFPNFPGTPTFILNGEMLDRVASWRDLEGRLKAALGN